MVTNILETNRPKLYRKAAPKSEGVEGSSTCDEQPSVESIPISHAMRGLRLSYQLESRGSLKFTSKVDGAQKRKYLEK